MCNFAPSFCPDGGIGRRAGLKHQWINLHAGSIPALGTRWRSQALSPPFLFLFAPIYVECFRGSGKSEGKRGRGIKKRISLEMVDIIKLITNKTTIVLFG